MNLSWVDDQGTLPLDGTQGVHVELGASGLNSPPMARTLSPRFGDGSRLERSRRPAREFLLPLHVVDDGGNVDADVGALAERMYAGGILRSTFGGVTRDLTQVYAMSGFDGTLSARGGGSGRAFRKLPVMLQALDPWWLGTSKSESASISTSVAFDAAVGFDDASTSFNGGEPITLVNDGRDDTPITITLSGALSAGSRVIGPGVIVELADDLADGSTLTISSDVAAGEGPRLNGGPIDWSLITADSDTFTIATGTSVITFEAISPGVNAAADISFRERFASPS